VWTATGGSIADPGAAATTWTPDAALAGKTVTLTAVATDGLGAFSDPKNITMTVSSIPSSLNGIQTGSPDFDSVRDITADSNGNICITGTTNGALACANSGGSDIFVMKYDPAFNMLWTRQFGSSANDLSGGIVSDSSGSIIICGASPADLVSGQMHNSTDVFIRKYDPNGSILFTAQAGSFTGEVPLGMAADASGNIYVAGYTPGSPDANVNHGMNDIFVSKFNSNGIKQWTILAGSSSNDYANSISCDAAGCIWITGYTEGALNGNSSLGSSDIIVMKFDSRGTLLRQKQFGTSGIDIGYKILIAPDDAVYIAGYTTGSLNGNTNAGSSDIFAVKLDEFLNVMWTKQYGTPQTDAAYGMALDNAGNIFITGYTLGMLDGCTKQGSQDMFISKLDSSGNLHWSRQIGTAGSSTARSAAGDSTGNVYLAGFSTGNLFDINKGSQDIFVIKAGSQ